MGSVAPALLRLCALREDVLVDVTEDGDVQVTTTWGELRVPAGGAVVRDLLNRMTLGPISAENVLGEVPDDRRGAETDAMRRSLALLGSTVIHSLGAEEMYRPLLLSAVPITRAARFELVPAEAETTVKLSRFASVRSEGRELVLESPLADYRVELHRPQAAMVVAGLGGAVTVAGLADRLDLPFAFVADVVEYLTATGMLLRAGVDGFAEDTDPGLDNWAPYELLFHARSRIGRDDRPIGLRGTEEARARVAPALGPVPEGRRFPLHRPDLSAVAAADPALTTVIEGRVTRRSFSDRPLTAEIVGELLSRTARVREVRESDGDTTTDRPYPSVADRYELELYLVLDRCSGLPRGVYHYDPLGHALTLIGTPDRLIDELLDDARFAAGSPQRPALLITMTARLGRYACAFEGIGYASALRHVGVLQQTLYLVSTAMGLAPCALALGNVDTATEAFGLDWPAEASVGEFAIGA